jgi:hypothetical protein
VSDGGSGGDTVPSDGELERHRRELTGTSARRTSPTGMWSSPRAWAMCGYDARGSARFRLG